MQEFGGAEVEAALATLDEYLAVAPLDVDLVCMYTSPLVFQRRATEVEVTRHYLQPYEELDTPFAQLTSRPFRTYVNPRFKEAICAALTRLCGYVIEPSPHPDIVSRTTKTLDSQRFYAVLLEAGVGDGDIIYYS